jgi:hypothetical protein
MLTTQAVIVALKQANLYSNSLYMRVSKTKTSNEIQVWLANTHDTNGLAPRMKQAESMEECFKAKGWSFTREELRDCSLLFTVKRESTPEYSVMVKATVTFYKEIKVKSNSEPEAKILAKKMLLDEDPTTGQGWKSEEAPRFSVEDCELITSN